MNLFILDENPALAAQYHCDNHMNGSILEIADMMCMVADHMRIYFEGQYHWSVEASMHPCTQWAKASVHNRAWMMELAENLQKQRELAHPGIKLHKSLRTARVARSLIDPDDKGDWTQHTPFVQLVPAEFQARHSAVCSYRLYYEHKLEHGLKMEWKNRTIPEWLNNGND